MSANLKLSKRLLLELKEFNQNRNEISHLKELKLKEDSNLFEWFSLLFGPLDSIFNGLFSFSFTLLLVLY